MHRYSVVFYVRVMYVLVSADDMGLGKTLTMIALVLKTKEEVETEGVSREDADDVDEENESLLYSEKRTCKYYFTFPRHFHFLQLYHLYNSQSLYILSELTNFFPCSFFHSGNIFQTYIFIFSFLTLSFFFFIFKISFLVLFLFCLEISPCPLTLVYICVPFKAVCL